VNKSRIMKRMGEMRSAYRILVGKPERKIRLGRHRRRWKNIRMDLVKGVDSMDWRRTGNSGGSF
jgi:hypothetical protein